MVGCEQIVQAPACELLFLDIRVAQHCELSHGAPGPIPSREKNIMIAIDQKLKKCDKNVGPHHDLLQVVLQVKRIQLQNHSQHIL